MWWKFMDLSILQNFFNLDTYFSNGEFWEPQKEILNEKFQPLWTKIGLFFLQRFESTTEAAKEFFVAYQDRLKAGQELSINSFINNYSSSLNGLLTQEPMRARGIIVLVI